MCLPEHESDYRDVNDINEVIDDNPQDSSYDLHHHTSQSFSGDSDLGKAHSPEQMISHQNSHETSQINAIVFKLKDEVKPMFIFNSKYRQKDSMGSNECDDGIMTPNFSWQNKQTHSISSSVSSIHDKYF